MQTLDIDLLRTFHTIARLGRFKDAAAHLGRSSSAVSVQVQRLEEIVGERLFERDNRHLEISPRGRQLLRETSGLLAEHDRVMALLSNEPVRGRIRLGIPEEYSGPFLKTLLPLFVIDNPGVTLEVEAAPSSAAVAALFDRGRLDVAVTVSAAAAGDVVSEVQPVWAAAPDMRVAAQAALPVALPTEGCPYRAAAIEALERSGRPWRVILTSGNSGAIAAAVEGGLAAAVVSRPQLAGAVVDAGARLGLPGIAPHKVLYRRREPTAAEDRFRQALARYFRA
jgi:DNA-binding transcriptional LysR family regulator